MFAFDENLERVDTGAAVAGRHVPVLRAAAGMNRAVLLHGYFTDVHDGTGTGYLLMCMMVPGTFVYKLRFIFAASVSEALGPSCVLY